MTDLKISRTLTHLMRNILKLANAALWAILEGLTKKQKKKVGRSLHR